MNFPNDKDTTMTIPRLGLGTFRLSDAQIADSVGTALELGYRHIDSAQIYGTEAAVGRALARAGVPRPELFLTTKIWTDNLGRQRLIPSLEESLERLGTDYADLTLIHWPAPAGGVPLGETLEALMAARERGLTRAIGVSNFTVAQLQAAIDIVGSEAIATQQIELHPYLQNRKVADFCRRHGIALTAYMPLAYGKVASDPVLQDIAAAHGATPAQVALAWLLQQGTAVIPSSTRRQHLADNLGAARLQLSAADQARIAALECNGRLADPDFAPAWD